MRILQGRRVRRLAAAMLLVAVVGAGGYWLFEPGWRYGVRGVDVSHHQGSIDWAALAADRTDFAYIKATEGGDWTDPMFGSNWQAAGEAGVLRGAYHFFTLCTSGADQASHMIDVVPDEPGMLPPAVDLEFGGNCSARPTVEDFQSQLDSFLVAIESHYRMRPVVYTNPEFYDTYLDEQTLDVTWWIMSPVIEPWGSPEWTFWQSFTGFREGVDGRIDRNVFKGDMSALVALTDRTAP